MSPDRPSLLPRFALLAAFATSVALFLTALMGIASIDPGARAAGVPPAGDPAALHGVSLNEKSRDDARRRDCPFRQHRDGSQGRGAGDVTS